MVLCKAYCIWPLKSHGLSLLRGHLLIYPKRKEKLIIVVSLEEFLFCGQNTHRFRIYDLEEGMAKTKIERKIARKTSHSPTPSYAMPFIMNYNFQWVYLYLPVFVWFTRYVFTRQGLCLPSSQLSPQCDPSNH